MQSGTLLIVTLAVAMLLAACATKQAIWVRTDGKMIQGDVAMESQFEVDVTVCRGDMQKSNLAMTAEAGFGRGAALADVYSGCMAQRGYVLRTIAVP